jgi:hypothetical protein
MTTSLNSEDHSNGQQYSAVHCRYARATDGDSKDVHKCRTRPPYRADESRRLDWRSSVWHERVCFLARGLAASQSPGTPEITPFRHTARATSNHRWVRLFWGDAV